jgi:hypothetical protein
LPGAISPTLEQFVRRSPFRDEPCLRLPHDEELHAFVRIAELRRTRASA